MNQTRQLLNTLKKCLKAQGITYRQLAQTLNLSEASVKRLFSEKTFSLARVEEILDILEMSFYDLAKLSANADAGPAMLSVEQELALSENQTLLVFYYLLLNGRPPESIVREYTISESESVKLLLRLDTLDLIDLYPDNRIRFRTPRTVLWRKDGPIREKYESRIKNEFLNAAFDGDGEHLSFENGKLSDASHGVFLKKIDRLLKDYNELAELDNALPRRQCHHTGLMIAFRPWVFSLIETYRR